MVKQPARDGQKKSGDKDGASVIFDEWFSIDRI